jgi:hypothetical protein
MCYNRWTGATVRPIPHRFGSDKLSSGPPGLFFEGDFYRNGEPCCPWLGMCGQKGRIRVTYCRNYRRRASDVGERRFSCLPSQELKAVVAELAPELRLLNKGMIGDGGDEERNIPPPSSWRSFGIRTP